MIRAWKQPETRYARSGDVSIAYQVIGDGELDLVLVHGWVSSFQPGWEGPRSRASTSGWRRSARLIMFDKRGTGCPTAWRTWRRSRTGWTTCGR